ncbi:MAG: serine/threonine-protein phosphatase [Oscillospiraceae bacterium]|nr:serine/threonine-protein phosphatase [Oscillospiraceae bacterium]
MYYVCGVTDKGAVCDINEDSYLVGGIVMDHAQTECELRAPFIAAVADGVGGEDAGEIASRTTLTLLSSVRPTRRTDLCDKVMKIHRKVREVGLKTQHGNMQSTLCALCVIDEKTVYALNAGDSRLYLFRDGRLRQISTDQSLVQMLYEQGKLSMREKNSHSGRNIIFPVIGNVEEDPTPVLTEIEGGIRFGDVVLICSDGLSDYVPAGEIEEILSWPMRLSKRLRCLIDSAMDHGSKDNITAVGVFMK